MSEQIDKKAEKKEKKIKWSKMTKAIRAIGYSPIVFAEEVLGTTYQSFRYRVNEGKITLDQYHKIMAYTGKSFEDLWPNPYKKPKSIRLDLSATKAPAVSVNPAPKKKEVQESVQPDPAPSSFSVVDVYEGLPSE